MTKELSVEQMSALYDRIYNIADRLIKKHNPCGIQKGKNGFVRCLYSSCEVLCCGGCIHWNHGCTVKALACKLYLCNSVNKLVKNRLTKLQHIAFVKYGLCINLCRSKEDWLTKLKESRSEKTHRTTAKA